MKVYLIKDLSDNDTKFIVFDESYKEKYYVTSKGKSFEKLNIYDLENNIVAKIRKIPLPVMFAFNISCNKKSIKLILNTAKNAANCYFYGICWRAIGCVFSKDYDLVSVDNSLIMSQRRNFKSCHEGYELSIFDDDSELFCIASAVCINIVSIVDNPVIQAV